MKRELVLTSRSTKNGLAYNMSSWDGNQETQKKTKNSRLAIVKNPGPNKTTHPYTT